MLLVNRTQGTYKVAVKIDPAALPAEAAKPDGYTLDIAAGGATITGNDAGGAFYGLITLLGLIPQGGQGTIPVVCGLAARLQQWAQSWRSDSLSMVLREWTIFILNYVAPRWVESLTSLYPPHRSLSSSNNRVGLER